MRLPGPPNRQRRTAKRFRRNDRRQPTADSRLKEPTMAVETQHPAQLGHGGEPIVRDKLFIGGEWVEPSGGGTIEVVDSTTEEVMGRVPEGTAEDVGRAVEAARAGFEEWSRASLGERADACRAIGAA